MITSFDYNVLVKVKALEPSFKTGYITSRDIGDPGQYVAADQFMISIELVRKELVDQIHGLGKKMTEATRRILFQYDHQGLAERRRENYRKLYAELSGVRGLSVLSGPLDPEGKYVPFGFVVLVKRREDFYWYLARRGVIGEIQWRLPTDYYQPGEAAWYLSDHNLMLFCDHRYGEAEMNYVIETVKDYFNGR